MARLPLIRRFAARRAPAPVRAAVAIEIRWAAAGDRAALDRLAALDERALPAGRLLVAEVEGALWAALDAGSSEAISNPFMAAADAVELLRFRAAQIAAAERRGVGMRHRLGRAQASATVGA